MIHFWIKFKLLLRIWNLLITQFLITQMLFANRMSSYLKKISPVWEDPFSSNFKILMQGPKIDFKLNLGHTLSWLDI